MFVWEPRKLLLFFLLVFFLSSCYCFHLHWFVLSLILSSSFRAFLFLQRPQYSCLVTSYGVRSSSGAESHEVRKFLLPHFLQYQIVFRVILVVLPIRNAPHYVCIDNKLSVSLDKPLFHTIIPQIQTTSFPPSFPLAVLLGKIRSLVFPTSKFCSQSTRES